VLGRTGLADEEARAWHIVPTVMSGCTSNVREPC